MHSILKKHVKQVAKAVKDYGAYYPNDVRLRKWAIRGVRVLRQPTHLNKALNDHSIELIARMIHTLEQFSLDEAAAQCKALQSFLLDVDREVSSV